MVVVVSAVSMCSQNDSVAWQPAGIVTDWDSVSVCVVPYPSSQAFQVPEWVGWLEPFWPITPDVAVHDVVPDSKPGLASFWPGLAQLPGGGVGARGRRRGSGSAIDRRCRSARRTVPVR